MSTRSVVSQPWPVCPRLSIEKDRSTKTPPEISEASGAAWRQLRLVLSEVIEVVDRAEVVVARLPRGDFNLASLHQALEDLRGKLS